MIIPARINTIDDIDFLQILEATRNPVIDFTPIEFIRPVGVVALLATLERLAKLSDVEDLTFRLPKSPEVREYLLMAGVFDVMRRLISFDSVQPEALISKKPPERPMVPCRYFASESDIDEIADRMEEDFKSVLPKSGSILGACHTAFSELATNVIYHAESQGGYVLAQQYNFSSGAMVEIAVADCGIGIQESLRKNQKYTDIPSDEDAIELAIREGVTSLDDRYRGYGLAHVTYDVRVGDGRQIAIRSGYGTMILQGNGEIEKRRNSPRYSGTILNVSIPC